MGAVLGLILSPFLELELDPARILAISVLLVVSTASSGRSRLPAAVVVAVAGALAGLTIGDLRLEAIDGAALRPPAIEKQVNVRLAGFIEAEPTRSRGVIRFRLSSGRGRLMVQAADPGPNGLPEPGQGIVVSGRVGPPPEWYRAVMVRHGLKTLMRARRLVSNGEKRPGLGGLIDRIRGRAERALGRAMPDREVALARGFVLGQDAAIDARTRSDFRASGLSHLLAVSGQNVVLLGLLAWPFLALLGVGAQARRALTVLLIMVYIPLAGGGPSIQRAGVMGGAALAAAGAGRTTSRLWVLASAAAVTLGLDPRSCLDPGWQLSFAAVIGIALLAAPLRDRFESLVGFDGRWRPVAEGLAVTVAATMATAPLIAFHFGRLPVGTVAANLIVVPAVAPAMWLGMISAALGQIWSTLAVPFNLVNSVVLAMIARAAAWFGRPGWAEVEIEIGIWGMVILSVAILIVCALLVFWWRPDPMWDAAGRGGRWRRVGLGLAAGTAVMLAAVFLLPGGPRPLGPPPANGIRVDFLDVGQGDAILIRPARGPALLIDGGPPGGGVESELKSAGVDHLQAVLLTHPDLDHYGGLLGLLEHVTVDRLLYDAAPKPLLAAARSAGARTIRVGRGVSIRLGAGARMDLLWPPAGRPPGPNDPDPNLRSVGGVLDWHGYRMYLPGDGEAESVPVDPGPIDLLKVAHHGSADAGLSTFLARSRPEVAVIQVGEENRYGHPTAETLRALTDAGADVLRTDRDGTISVILNRAGARIELGD